MCASVCDGAFVCRFVHSMHILGTHLYKCVPVSVTVRLCVFFTQQGMLHLSTVLMHYDVQV